VTLPSTLARALAVVEGLRGHRDLADELRRELEKIEERQKVRSVVHERRAAVEGEKFLWREGDTTEHELVVRPASPGREGRWWCISCGVAFADNLDRDLHCGKGGKHGHGRRKITFELGDKRARHVLAWRNWATGQVEVP
jgi:hypothetical protein